MEVSFEVGSAVRLFTQRVATTETGVMLAKMTSPSCMPLPMPLVKVSVPAEILRTAGKLPNVVSKGFSALPGPKMVPFTRYCVASLVMLILITFSVSSRRPRLSGSISTLTGCVWYMKFFFTRPLL